MQSVIEQMSFAFREAWTCTRPGPIWSLLDDSSEWNGICSDLSDVLYRVADAAKGAVREADV